MDFLNSDKSSLDILVGGKDDKCLPTKKWDGVSEIGSEVSLYKKVMGMI